MRRTSLARAIAEAASSSASASSSTTPMIPRPVRLAIIGAGPSGFYAASRLLNRVPYETVSALPRSQQPLLIDVFDRLPVPHGLVRYGVAPDHPDVKNVEHKFETVSQDPRLRFAGNVNVIQDAPNQNAPYSKAVQVPLEELSRYYTHILFSYGSSSGRSLGIPGSRYGELANVYTALSFVNWYNGHPESHDPSLKRSDFEINLANKQHMTVIGAGNVALDVTRILLRSSTPFLSASEVSGTPTSNKGPGLSALEETDVPEPVLAELARCKVSDVDIFARRGPAQLAFTNKEVREMLNIEGVALRPLEGNLLETAIRELESLAESAKSGTMDPDEVAKITSEVRVKKRLLGLLQKGSKTKYAPRSSDLGKQKQWGLNFFHSPAMFLPREGSEDQRKPPVGSVEWNLTRLQTGTPTPGNLDATSPGKVAWGNNSSSAAPASAALTGKTETTQTDLVVSSVGYRSEPLWSASDGSSKTSSPATMEYQRSGHLRALPFDKSRNIVPNQGGRVLDPSTNTVLPRTYVSGWLARGPVGVIASTMMDAYSVAETILHDIQHPSSEHQQDHQPQEIDQNDFLHHLQRRSSNRIVSFQDWRRIDQEEQRRGQQLGKLREKFLTVDDMLKVIS